ncbi:HNH endonuclease [Prosthecobacter sp.]|uniref:HNH endonuclease n=1 Tax=Prosthecobacter sp. TaxID=1965333 RepID=UPI00378466B2
MNAASCDQICSMVQRKLGLQLSGEVSDGQMLLWPSAFHENESFSLRFKPGWRSAEAMLTPGTFAGEMVRSMGACSASAKLLFSSYAQSLARAGVHIGIRVNGTTVDAQNPSAWATDWTSFDFTLRKSALVFDLNKDVELLPVADLLITPLIGMAMSLIGTVSEEEHAGEIEGAAVQYLATRYERKKLNRDACIRIHGTRCHGCGFSFGENYGEIASDYIEVHHIEPLATTGEVLINPATDLIPLCSNCHSVVHRVTPPLGIEELVRIVKERRPK